MADLTPGWRMSRVVLVLLVLGLVLAWPAKTAVCQGFCPSIPCLERTICGPGCVCITSGPGMGVCAGIR